MPGARASVRAIAWRCRNLTRNRARRRAILSPVLPYLDELERVTPEIAALVPPATARRLRAIPLGLTRDTPPALRVAMRDARDLGALEHLRALTGYPIVPVEVASVHLGPALDRIYAYVPLALPSAPAAADDWQRIAVQDSASGMLHDSSMSKLFAATLITCAIIGIGWYWQQSRRFERKTEYREYGTLSAPTVGIRYDLPYGAAWARGAAGPGFVQHYRGDDQWLELRRVPGTTDLRAAAHAASALWRHPVDPGGVACAEVADRPASTMACHSPGFHQWAWVDGADTLVATLECADTCPIDDVARLVESVRPLVL